MLKNLFKTSSLLLVLILFHCTSCLAAPAIPRCPPDVRVIFVNKNCVYEMMGTGDGSYATPYNSLGVALASSAPCDVIYVFPGTYDAAVENMGMPYALQANQRLLGTTTEAFQRCANCTKPVLQNSNNNTILFLADNNEVSGFTFETNASFEAISNNSVPITDALITDNTFNLSNGGRAIALQGCPNLGTVTFMSNQFVDLNNTTTRGISISSVGRTVMTVTTNQFTNTNDAFVAISLTNDCTFSVLNNRIISNGLTAKPVIDIESSSGVNVKTTISQNNLSVFSNLTSSAIQLSISNGGTMCATMNDNFVETQLLIPGYYLQNTSFDGAFMYFDSNNLGTLLTNIQTEEVTFPITYTQACP